MIGTNSGYQLSEQKAMPENEFADIFRAVAEDVYAETGVYVFQDGNQLNLKSLYLKGNYKIREFNINLKNTYTMEQSINIPKVEQNTTPQTQTLIIQQPGNKNGIGLAGFIMSITGLFLCCP